MRYLCVTLQGLNIGAKIPQDCRAVDFTKTSSVPYWKKLGHIEPILSWDGLLVLTRDRINLGVFVKSAAGLVAKKGTEVSVQEQSLKEKELSTKLNSTLYYKFLTN